MKADSIKLRNSIDPIVVVDDSEMDIEIVRRVHKISEIKNPLRTFRTGIVFLEYMDRVRAGEEVMPAVVFMDVNMPGLNGFEVVKKVREDQIFEAIPVVIMLTNSDNPADIERAQEAGANAYQQKHHDIHEYINFMKALAIEE